MSCLFSIFYFDNNMTEKMIKDLISQWDICVKMKVILWVNFWFFPFYPSQKKVFV